MRRAVPGTDECGCPGLGAAHGMEHQPFHRDLPPRRITGVPCQEINDRGIALDMDVVENAIRFDERSKVSTTSSAGGLL